MRQRDEIWVKELTAQLAAGEVLEAAKLAAAIAADRNIANTIDPGRQMQLAESKYQAVLRRPGVREAIQEVYEQFVNFSPIEAHQLHVSHMRGALTKQVVSKVLVYKDGKPSHQETVVNDVLIPPSWAALKTYLDLTMPKPPIRVQGEHIHGFVNGPKPPAGTTAPETQPRTVGPPPPPPPPEFVVDAAADDEAESEDDVDDDEEEGPDD